VEREQPILDAKHRGRVDRLALEDAVDQLAAFGQAEDLGQRARRGLAFEPFDGAWAEYQHPVRGLAAERLLPAEGADIDFGPIDVLREGGRGRIANRKADAVGGEPLGVGDANAAGRAVPSEHDIALRLDPLEFANLAIIGGADFGVEIELLGDIGDPAGAKTLPR